MHIMKVMTHSKLKEIRKEAINSLKTPYSPVCLLFLGKRLRDKDDEIRKIVFKKLTLNDVKIEKFESKEIRMLIIKEGLTDPSESVREACIGFLK